MNHLDDDDDLFDYSRRIGFEGMTEKDNVDLKKGVRQVAAFMADGLWHTAHSIIAASGQREGLRRLRELRDNGRIIEKRRIAETREWEYRLLI